jgi:hypothetical protein
VSIAHSIFAQAIKARMMNEEHVWNVGIIVTAEGEELHGLIWYNDNDGMVVFSDSVETHSLTPRRVTSFQFSEKESGRLKVFRSLNYHDADTGSDGYVFFEVLKELPSFIVLAKMDRLKVEPRQSWGKPYSSPRLMQHPQNRPMRFSQTQTIFFLGEKGVIEPYLNIVETEDERIVFTGQTKSKFVNEDLLKQYTGRNYLQMEQRAKENNLSFKKKDDLLKILDYYEQLVSK